jgi:hypothetical protein
MEVRRFHQANAFLEAAMPLLGADEPRHNLLFGLADTLLRRPQIYPTFHLWLAVDADGPAGAALQTPPYGLVLARPRTERALDALVEAVVGDGDVLPGVNGALPEAEGFADRWARSTGGRWTRAMTQGIYACDRVLPVPVVPGTPRMAGPPDFDALFPLVEAFADEALIAQAVRDRERSIATTRGRLQDEPGRGGFWVWEVDRRIVALSGHGGSTPTGIRIGPVYTPPAERRRGYATALVHAQTAWLLAHAVRSCFLYTDMGNPTSNAVYRRIGYRQVADAVEIGFEVPQPQSGGTGGPSAGSTT